MASKIQIPIQALWILYWTYCDPCIISLLNERWHMLFVKSFLRVYANTFTNEILPNSDGWNFLKVQICFDDIVSFFKFLAWPFQRHQNSQTKSSLNFKIIKTYSWCLYLNVWAILGCSSFICNIFILGWQHDPNKISLNLLELDIICCYGNFLIWTVTPKFYLI